MTSPFSLPFDELEPGTRFRTRGRTITEADITTFSGLTGDWHPQHADAEWARNSAFGERIAHGLLVLSCAAGLVPFDHERVVALRRVRDATFKRPDLVEKMNRIIAKHSPGQLAYDKHTT